MVLRPRMQLSSTVKIVVLVMIAFSVAAIASTSLMTYSRNLCGTNHLSHLNSGPFSFVKRSWCGVDASKASAVPGVTPTHRARVRHRSTTTNMSVTSTSTVLNPKDIVVRDALKEHQATLVFLHGLGDTGRGWCAGFYGLPNVKVVCPTAPSIPIDVNNGYVMPGWFDIYDFPIQNIDEVREDGPGILHSMKLVEEVVAKEKEANPNIPIFVGGFSQGGAIALTFAMRSQIKVSGLIALSCWLPLRKDYPAKESSANKDTPIFMGHGTNDQVVFESFGRLSFDYLKKLGRTIQYYSVPGMGHSAEDGEMEALNNFVKSHIKN